MEEAHLQHMKALLGSYAHSVEDTHVQIGQVRTGHKCKLGKREAPPSCHTTGASPPHPPPLTLSPTQVHEEFKQNVENVTVDMLLRKFAESKGIGREKPGE